MLVVISPAKRLDFDKVQAKIPPSDPAFQKDAISLSTTARRLSVAKLQKLMAISPDLAKLTQGRFRAFDPDPVADVIKPAILAFAGDTYQGLEAASLDAAELAYAQEHLRILSGLYGLLRPMDQIQPYRLEMGSRLVTRRGKTLYQYWGDRLTAEVNQTLSQTGDKALINCASVEYFTALPTVKLTTPVITPVFLEDTANGPKIISFFAKKARGAMARFILQNRLTDPGALLEFDTGGYRYQPALSEDLKPAFLRPSANDTAPES